LAAADVTPVQFAILNALQNKPGVDQITLAKHVAFDPATSGSVIGRLESKGWVERRADEVDRRRKLLVLTPQGLQALQGMHAAVTAVQAEILAPLPLAAQAQFMQLLTQLVAGHEQGEG
jgi:DNA-binding MarR family transcriptional regulator